MLCHIFGLANTQKFSEELVPLIEATSDNYIMDWETILSNNLSMQIRNYRQKCNVLVGKTPPFYMHAYIMVFVCLSYYFSSLGWKWTNEYSTPIHIYFDILWESKYHLNFYKVFLKATVPIH